MSASSIGQLSARDVVEHIRRGLLTCEAVTQHYADRSLARSRAVHAWAHLAVDEAIAASREKDRQGSRGILNGVPVGIKDLFDTAGMPTAYGSKLYRGYRPRVDAASVGALREAGGVFLGKTQTVEFGASRPCATRNPLALGHTPGGSSSGSAAAVSDGQVLAAIGTQTGGSVIRPAAFCGIVGFKPSFGRLSLAGTKSYSWTMDTVGTFTRCVADARLVFRALLGQRDDEEANLVLLHTPRLHLFWGPFADCADTTTRSNLQEIANKCAAAGARVSTTRTVPEFDQSLDWQRIISRYEMARSLAYEWQTFKERLGRELFQEIEEGRSISEQQYLVAKQGARRLQAALIPSISEHGVLLTLAVPGEAPAGLQTTGDATFNKSWSLLGLPCLSIPSGWGPNGLPLAVQLVGSANDDEYLLAVGHWVERLLVS